MTIRTQLRAGGSNLNHNEAFRRESDRAAIEMRRELHTTSRKGDRLELLVIRAGIRAGGRYRRFARYASGARGRW